jgi:hypothetical protein
MQRLSQYRALLRIGRALTIAAAVLSVSALSQPNVAYAFGGGGGFHGGGGGFHGGGGGFHGGGGYHGGGFHGGFGGLHGGEFHDDRFHDGRFRGGFGGFGFFPYYGYYDYGDYGDYGQPYSQTWYYCSDPAGYYPYVSQCNTSWQTVPAS